MSLAKGQGKSVAFGLSLLSAMLGVVLDHLHGMEANHISFGIASQSYKAVLANGKFFFYERTPIGFNT